MIEEIGTITAVDNDHIWVETQIKTTCNGCAAEDNCGTGVVAKAFATKQDTLILRCKQEARVGQQVKLGIPEQTLVKASMLVYLIPLLVLILSAATGQWVLASVGLEHELYVIGLAFLSFYVSFRWVRHYLQGEESQHYQPRLLALLPRDAQVIPVTVKD